MNRANRFNSIYLFLIVISTLATVGVTILSIYRGFDFTDEGLALLKFAHTDIYHGGLTNFALIVHRFTWVKNPDVVFYRWFSIITTFLTSVFFSYCLNVYVKNKINISVNYITVLSVCVIGNFLIYSTGTTIVYYDTLINVSIQMVAALLMLLIAEINLPVKNLVRINFISILIAFFCVLGFFVKISSGIFLMFVCAVAMIYYVWKFDLRTKIIVLSFFLFGFAFSFLLYFNFIASYSSWIEAVKMDQKLFNTYHIDRIIPRHFKDILNFIIFLKNFLWFPVALLLVELAKKVIKINKGHKIFKYAIIIVFAIEIAFQIYHFKFYRGVFRTPNVATWINSYFYLIVVIVLSALLIWNLKVKALLNQKILVQHMNEILIVMLLLSIPFIGAVGTNNFIFLNTIQHGLSWVALIYILYLYASKFYGNNAMFLFVLVPMLIATSQIIDGNMYVPYYTTYSSHPNNYFSQTESIEEFPQLHNMKLDKESKKFLIETQDVLTKNGFRKNYPIIAFWLPGVVYLMNGISPVASYYLYKDDECDKCNTLSYFKKNDPAPVFFIFDGQPLLPNTLKCMDEMGIKFPDNYNLAGTVFYPVTNQKILIYMPKGLL